jgi:hypothetical protein
MSQRKAQFLKDQVKKRFSLLKRIERLNEKEIELYKKRSAVKRYVAIQHLRESYIKKLKDIAYSIEAVAVALAEEGDYDDCT